MFGFLRSVVDHSESEVDTFQKQLQNELDSIHSNVSRAESRARKGVAGARVVRRLKNVSALSDTEASGTDGDSEDDRIVDFTWDFKFAKVGDDPEFWQKQYLPSPSIMGDAKPRPQGLRGVCEKSDRLLSSRQRLLDRQMRRMHHDQRREAALRKAVMQQPEVCTSPQTAMAVAVVATPKEGWQSSLLANEPPAAGSEGILRRLTPAPPKKTARVSFRMDLAHERVNVGLPTHFDFPPAFDSEELETSSEDELLQSRAQGSQRGERVGEQLASSSVEELSEQEPEDDTSVHACRYCRGNPYKKMAARGMFSPHHATASGLPFLHPRLAAQHARRLPRSCWRTLRKAHTTAFAKGVERVMVALKRGVNVAVKRVDCDPDNETIECSEVETCAAAMNSSSVFVGNNYFKLCVDQVYASDTTRANAPSESPTERVYVPTEYGIVIAVKDPYAVGVVIALAQFHFVNARLLNSDNFKNDMDTRITVVGSGSNISSISPHEIPTLLNTLDRAAIDGYTYYIHLCANTGFCTCIKPQSHIFTKNRMFDIGVIDIEFADSQDFTYVLPHSFTLDDLLS